MFHVNVSSLDFKVVIAGDKFGFKTMFLQSSVFLSIQVTVVYFLCDNDKFSKLSLQTQKKFGFRRDF